MFPSRSSSPASQLSNSSSSNFTFVLGDAASSDYIMDVVASDEHMMNWRDEDNKLVVEELSKRADAT